MTHLARVKYPASGEGPHSCASVLFAARSVLAECLQRGVLPGYVAADHGREQREQQLERSFWTELEVALELRAVTCRRERIRDGQVRISARVEHKPRRPLVG